MGKILMSELDHVKQLLHSGDIEEDTHRNVTLLARYYLNNGSSKQEAIAEICQFMSKNKDEYLEEKWIDYIEKTTDRESKSGKQLRNINEVWITQSENNIMSWLKKPERHVLFTLIVLARIYDNGNNTGWVTLSSSDIFGVCGKKCLSTVKQDELLFRLKELGLISYAKKINNLNIKVECIGNDEKIWRVDKVEKLNNQCENMFNVLDKGYKLCEECGLVSFKPVYKSPKKYCSSCYSQIHRKIDREYRKSKKID